MILSVSLVQSPQRAPKHYQLEYLREKKAIKFGDGSGSFKNQVLVKTGGVGEEDLSVVLFFSIVSKKNLLVFPVLFDFSFRAWTMAFFLEHL